VAKSKSSKRATVTSLTAIRIQAAPELVEIPGFRPGTTIRVKVGPVDLTGALLEAGVGNPLVSQTPETGVNPKIGPDDLPRILELARVVARQALVEPTYDEIAGIAPLTFEQHMAIFNHVTGGEVAALGPFREREGAPETGGGGGDVEEGP